MAKFILICGPQAVGKMTVGQELAKITDLKFMHNHETIDLPLKFFNFSSEPRRRLTDLFRFSIFEEVAKSDLEERLKRNKTENRLKNKPTKRDLEKSEKDLIKYMEKFRLNSYPGEIKEKNI